MADSKFPESLNVLTFSQICKKKLKLEEKNYHTISILSDLSKTDMRISNYINISISKYKLDFRQYYGLQQCLLLLKEKKKGKKLDKQGNAGPWQLTYLKLLNVFSIC